MDEYTIVDYDLMLTRFIVQHGVTSKKHPRLATAMGEFIAELRELGIYEDYMTKIRAEINEFGFV